MDLPSLLEAPLREAGIERFGFVGRAALREACGGLPQEASERFGIDSAIGAVAAALPYGDGFPVGEDPASLPAWAASQPGPLARLARFARAHWYAELSARLKAAAARIRDRLLAEGVDPGPAGDWRYFSNSRLPERRLALAAGLGRLGRHGLVMLPAHGSAVVLGLLLLPSSLKRIAEADVFPRPEPYAEYYAKLSPLNEIQVCMDPDCESCGACVAACPTGALDQGRGFERELCLQHWSAIPGRLPPAVEMAWGDRLYGCDACQEACPRFSPDASARTERGLLGPGLPAAWLAAAPEGDIRGALKGSVLGMGWIAIEALRRNARSAIAAAGHGK